MNESILAFAKFVIKNMNTCVYVSTRPSSQPVTPAAGLQWTHSHNRNTLANMHNSNDLIGTFRPPHGTAETRQE